MKQVLTRKQQLSYCVFLCIYTLVHSPLLAVDQTYRFERMWGAIQPSWYFHAPMGIAVDQSNYVYVADSANDRIRKFTSDGQFVTEWGSNGDQAGQFIIPEGIAVDEDGFVYVVDSNNDRIQKFTSDGQFVIQWGEFGFDSGQFNYPIGIAVDTHDYVYVADTFNDRVQKFTTSGDFVSEWGSLGAGPEEFDYPMGIAVGIDGSIYVCDTGNYRVQQFTKEGQYITEWGEDEFSGIASGADGSIYVSDTENDRIQKFTSAGVFITSWAYEGTADGRLDGPEGLAVDQHGFIYVSDSLNDRIEKFTSEGIFITIWGTSDGDGKFHRPRGITLVTGEEEAQFVYVVDYERHHIQKFTPQGQFIQMWGNTWAPGSDGSGEGELYHPTDVAVDQNGYVYVTDTGNDRVQKFTFDGQFLGTWGSYGNGPGEFAECLGIAVDQNNDVYVVDGDNHRVQKFTSNGDFITQWGSNGNGSGQFHFPQGIEVDDAGNVFVTDTGNHRVQKFTSSGVFVDQWGDFGTGEGEFGSAYGISADGQGNIYVSDSAYNTIQKFTSSGDFLERYGEPDDEPGTGPGMFNEPVGICADANGKLYIADGANHRVQVISPISYTTGVTKAVLVAGGGAYPGNTIWDATQMNANFAYRSLTYQGLTKEQIFYMSSALEQDLDNNGEMDDIDAEVTNENLEYALTEWATDANSVVVYLVDHGGINIFRMSGTETLDVAELDLWLDDLQESISDEVVVVYDACKSGSFLPSLIQAADKKRIVITSSHAEESAYFVSSGSISFSYFFWTNVFNGMTIFDAFLAAGDGIIDLFSQTPLLDDNGNGIGNEIVDGQYARLIRIGNGTESFDDAPIISGVSIDPELITGTSGTLYAAGVTDQDDIARVWAVIRPPDYQQGLNPIPVLGLPSVDLLPQGNDNYAITYDGFNLTGTYHIAFYARDRMGSTSAPQITTVSVNTPLRRKAIILAGGWQSDPLWAATEKNALLAYHALKFQGYTDDTIYLLSPVGLTGTDALATVSNIDYALNEWAQENTQDLVLYLIGPGSPQSFIVSKTDTLSVEELDGWLDELQSNITGRVTVVYDGHYSGSFLAGLTCPQDKERIVICSTGMNEPAHFLKDGDLCFSKFFWTQVLNGDNIRDAFRLAVDAISFSGLGQIPSLDDNGNGIGNEKTDGKIARNYIIGIGIMLAGDDPLINSVSPDQILNGESSVMLFTEDVTTTGAIDKVWAVIAPPPRQITTPSDVGVLPAIELTEVENNRYEHLYEGFTDFGAYQVTIYARDTQGNLSQPQYVLIYQSLGPDVYEEDDGYQTANAIVISTSDSNTNIPGQFHNFDTEGDEDWVIFFAEEDEPYTVETINPGTSADTVIEVYDSDGTTLLAEMDSGGSGEDELLSWSCPQDGAYYIRVRQYDSGIYGIDTEYELQVTQPEGPLMPGFLSGVVRNGLTQQLINRASIFGDPTGYAVTGTDGCYILAVPEGTYALTASDSYHMSETLSDISVKAGQITVAPDLNLQPMVDPNAIVIIGQGGAKSLTYMDGDGTIVTLKISNSGTAIVRCLGNNILTVEGKKGITLEGDNIQINEILLSDTTEQSSLIFTTKGGDGLATVNRIISSFPLKTLSGKGIDLTGEGVIFTEEGYITSVQLHDVLNGADITMAGTGCTKGISLKVNTLSAGTDVILGSGVKSLSAASWGQSEFFAPWANTVQVQGDCSANLTLTSQNAKGYALGKLMVSGTGQNMNLSLNGGVKSITLGCWQEGTLFAPFADKINLKGNAKFGILPDLTNVNLHLTDSNTKGYGLGTFKASGTVSNSQIIISHNVKSVNISQLNPGSVIAVGVNPGQGGYFDEDESSLGNDCSIKNLIIGNVETDNGGIRFGIHVDDFGKIVVQGQPFTVKDLPYLDGEFCLWLK